MLERSLLLEVEVKWLSRVYKTSSIDGDLLIDHNPQPEEEELEIEEEPVPTISPEEEREAILKEAHERASSILEKAKKESSHLLKDAKKKAEKLTKDSQKEAQRLKEESQRKGFSSGQKEGNQEGHKEAKNLFLKKSKEVMNRLDMSLQEIHHRMKKYEEEYPSKITELSLGIAREVIRREVEEDPTIIIQVTKEALASMNGVAKAVIRVNWRDLEVMENTKEEFLSTIKGLRRVEFQVDNELDPGGTVIETPQGGIDASIETKYKKIRERLMEVVDNE